MNGKPWKRQDNEESSLSIGDGGRKKRRDHGCRIPATNDSYENQRSYKKYTVAVVCAMGFEMSVIRYMLDREYPRLLTKQGDANLDVLGELWLPSQLPISQRLIPSRPQQGSL